MCLGVEDLLRIEPLLDLAPNIMMQNTKSHLIIRTGEIEEWVKAGYTEPARKQMAVHKNNAEMVPQDVCRRSGILLLLGPLHMYRRLWHRG